MRLGSPVPEELGGLRERALFFARVAEDNSHTPSATDTLRLSDQEGGVRILVGEFDLDARVTHGLTGVAAAVEEDLAVVLDTELAIHQTLVDNFILFRDLEVCHDYSNDHEVVCYFVL